MTGLTVFTLASLWCGLTGSVEMLIVARVVQGLGASMITPQTMAIITRIFPAARRGKAMALWGATAGVATLVGPILGGVLVDASRLGVDLLHQRAGRDLRPVPRRSAGADARDPHPLVRLARGRAQRRRHVPAGLRDPGGPPVPLVHHDLGDDRRRNRAPRPVRPVAGAQQAGAAGPARPVPRPQLLPGQRRHLGDGLRDHRAGDPAPAVGPGGPRAEPDQVGTAAGPDGDHDDRAGPPGRQPHRPRPSPDAHRVRVRGHDRVAGVAVLRDDARRVHRGADRPDGAARHRQRVHLGSQLSDRDPQPPDPAGRRRRRRLQRHPSGRRRARLGRHRGADRRPARGRGAAGVRGHGLDRRQAAGGVRPTASARRWRPRSCSRRRCWCWAWSRRCSSSGRATRGTPERPPLPSGVASADAGSAPPASAG